jgi:hypothetical protein
MKKAAVLLTGMFLVVGLAFAQTPQTPAKTTTATKTEATKSDSKSNCDPKMAKDCPAKKSCCAHDSKASSTSVEKKDDKGKK